MIVISDCSRSSDGAGFATEPRRARHAMASLARSPSTIRRAPGNAEGGAGLPASDADAPPRAASRAGTTVRRLNLANRQVDQARALISARASGDRAYRLLLQSVRTEPSLVNTYAALAEWCHSRGEDPYARLRMVWQTYGRGDRRALRFIQPYRRSDPALRLGEWCRRTRSGPALIVQFGDDLRHLDLYEYDGCRAAPALIGRIYSPRLVCSPRDFGSLPAAKQAIAEDAIKRGKDFRIVSHRGTIVSLDDRTVFGPTIDSLYFNAVLHDTVYRSSVALSARRVAEIGVGSGFLLCSLISALPSRPLDVVGSDIDPSAIATAERNVRHAIDAAQEWPGIRVRMARDARVLEHLPAGGVDLLVSNPPYIPERQYAGDNAYSGTRVIESLLVEHGPRVLAPGGVAVFLYSSLALPAVHRCLERSPLVPIRLAPARRVPLDLREVGSDPVWIDLLRREHGLEETLDDASHAYWHSLHMLALCRPTDHDRIAEIAALAARNGVP
jgi:tRNA1(Val) A37 N6-methylase TrmN6